MPQTLEVKHKIITVSELNRNAKVVLENNFSALWVSGEISNLKCYPSGHWYFSLKDTDAQIRCVMFKHKNQYLDWQPKNGNQVEIFALATLYEVRGDFQLNVETIRRAGSGSLFEAFEQLKKQLKKAGLFDIDRKKNPPAFPKQIGIITSPATAALHDVLATLGRRMPALPLIIYPTPVQGQEAAQKIASTIISASSRQECDVLILCRGGGSIEDLWAFNEEAVASAIAACTIPIIAGIGHETDFTIADLVADKRAPTPTAAAEIASPEVTELLKQLHRQRQILFQKMVHQIEKRMQKIDQLSHRHTHPGDRIQTQFTHLNHLQERLISCMTYQIDKKNWTIKSYQQRIESKRPNLIQLTAEQTKILTRLQQVFSRHIDTLNKKLQHQRTLLTQLNPQSILKRGYSITYSSQGTIIRDINQIDVNDKIRVKFAQGNVDAAVHKINKK